MSDPLVSILLLTSHIAKQNLTSRIFCPECMEKHQVIKWGFYSRYLFHDDDMIQIQRFRCLNGQCSRFTFSVLPHPFLPIVRVPLCFMLMLLSMYRNGHSVADLVRKSGKSWSLIRRAVDMAKQLRSFLQNEVKNILNFPSPCLDPATTWTAFAHVFSWAFFLNRF